MGWGTVQTRAASADLAGPSGPPRTASPQTALPGRNIETAPPEGFRQRITQGFQHLGKRLSSIVTALPGRIRLDAARRSTRARLVTLLDRLDLGDLDSPKLGVELARLAREKQQWIQKDPENAEREFGEMVRTITAERWPARHILHIEKAIGLTLNPKYDCLPETQLRTELAGLFTGYADEYRTAQGLKARHKNEIRKMGFDTAREVAGGIFWKGGTLSAAVKVFDKATHAAEFKDGATEADLQAARNELEEAGNRLLEALETSHPKKAQRALGGRYFGAGNWRAMFVDPRNQAQADLYNQFITGYNLTGTPNKAGVVEKSEQAKALLTRVAQDEPLRSRGAQRGPETLYFRELRKQRRYLEHAEALAASGDDADSQALREALGRLPTSTKGARTGADGEAPDYARALDTLHEVLAAADRKIAPLVANTVEQMRQLENVDDVAVRAEKAQQLVANTNDAVLMKLPAREQLALLGMLRGDLKQQPPAEPQWRAFRTAQSRLYMAMQLDPQLLKHEKDLRREVISELSKDKKLLQDARDLWHIYSPEQKRHVLLKVAQAHSKVLGCDPPRDIRFTSDPAIKGYAWRRDDRAILIGTTNRRYTDFEDMMDGVFHENSHNWQDHLVQGLNPPYPAIREKHPLYTQASMFAANLGFYNEGKPDYAAYRMQPVETHAYRSGMKLGAELMRMLAS